MAELFSLDAFADLLTSRLDWNRAVDRTQPLAEVVALDSLGVLEVIVALRDIGVEIDPDAIWDASLKSLHSDYTQRTIARDFNQEHSR